MEVARENLEDLIQVELQSHWGSDQFIGDAAWNSTYNKDRRNAKYDDPKEVERIVRRVVSHEEGTPVESVYLRFWFSVPIFIDRHIMTHRIATHNGLSGRYRTMSNDWYGIPKDVENIWNKINHTLGTRARTEHEAICNIAYNQYNTEIAALRTAEKAGTITNDEYKRAREIARTKLPVSGMVERLTVMNLRSFANFYRKRSAPNAQLEVQILAKKMLAEVKKANVAPTAIATLEECGWRI